MALAAVALVRQAELTMGAYPGRKQVRTRAKRAAKNDRIIIAKRKTAAAKK
jgi:hypothetical protein